MGRMRAEPGCTITLADAKLAVGKAEGIGRNNWALARGFTPRGRRVVPEISEKNNCLGACGELAVEAWSGGLLRWQSTIGRTDAKDFEPNIQVRTRFRDIGRLFVRDVDDPNDRFILVTATRSPDTFWVRGWLVGVEAPRYGELVTPDEGRPAWYIATRLLHPMADLRDLLEAGL